MGELIGMAISAVVLITIRALEERNNRRSDAERRRRLAMRRVKGCKCDRCRDALGPLVDLEREG